MIVCCDFDATGVGHYERVAAVLAGYGVAFHTSVTTPMPLVTGRDGQALAVVVRSALETNPSQPVFYFGHGRRRPPALLGRGEGVVLDRRSWALLRDRVLCVTACHSADEFGRELQKHGVSLLGYRGPLNIFFEEPWISRMQEAVLAGPDSLLKGQSLGAARDAAADAYDRLASDLYRSPNPSELVIGPFVEQNARAVEMIGDSRRTLRDRS